MKQEPTPDEFDFAEWLREFGHGATNKTAGARLREIVKACSETGRKGSLTIKIDVLANMIGLAEVRCSITGKKPEAALPGAAYYTTEDGRLVNEDPKQLKLPGRVLDVPPLKTIPFTPPNGDSQ